jgi:hypothetical protein
VVVLSFSDTAAENLQSNTSANRRRAPNITVALRQLRAPTLSSRQSGGYTEECCAVRAEAGGKASEGRTRQPAAQCAILLLAICASTGAAAGRVYLTCITNKVVIVDTPTGSSSSDTKENLTFWIDEASKRVSFADGVPLSIQRFDDRWISVTGGGVSYELDRESRSLSFAGTIMKEGTATIIIGAGRCSVGSDAR